MAFVHATVFVNFSDLIHSAKNFQCIDTKLPQSIEFDIH